MPDIILTLDLGTTRLKVATFDLTGKLLGQVSSRNQEQTDELGRYQQADSWWRDSVHLVRVLLDRYSLNPRDVVGVSLSGRAGAAVFVTARGEVVCDPWSDNRHGERQRTLAGIAEAPAYALALLAKAMWLRDEAPARFQRVAHILYAKDFLLYRLTGLAITDFSSGPDGPWDPAWLAASDIDQALLPAPAAPATLAGQLTADAAHQLGLVPGLPVAVGGHDGICANTGAGVIGTREFALTLGTHAVVRTLVDQLPAGALRFYGYPPDQHVIGGNALMAGRSLDWFLDNWFHETEQGRQALFTTMDRLLSRPLTSALAFYPYLAGQLSPVRRPHARASFVGLDLGTNRDDMYRAVVQGVSFAVADVFDQVAGWTGAPTRVGVTGSGASSHAWLQMLANSFGHALQVTDASSEGRGAAIFCATALGHYAAVPDAIAAMVETTATVEPNDDHEICQAARIQWQSGANLALRD